MRWRTASWKLAAAEEAVTAVLVARPLSEHLGRQASPCRVTNPLSWPLGPEGPTGDARFCGFRSCQVARLGVRAEMADKADRADRAAAGGLAPTTEEETASLT